jgi:thermostable 8-oxoguanine DNA glycosylase
LREQLAELEHRERSHASAEQINESRSAFYALLKRSLSADLIDNNEAEDILEVIKDGSMSFQEAFIFLKNILES